MPSRFYFPGFNQSYGSPPDEVPHGVVLVSNQVPARDPAWPAGSFGNHKMLLRSKQGTGGVINGLWTPSAANPIASSMMQFISDPLAGQVIAGTVKAMIACYETNTTDNYNPALAVNVVNATGEAVRGSLLSSVAGGGTEFNVATAQSRKFPPGWTGAGAALTPVTAQDGDRLSIEVGLWKTSTSTAIYAGEFGCDMAKADYSETEGATGGTPWIEFSQEILFYVRPWF